MSRLRTKSERDRILESISALYPEKNIELDFTTPFQLLVAVILSAQMTDKGVNKATKKLFEKVKTPQDLLGILPEEVETMLRSINYYKVKTRHIFETAEKLLLDHNSIFHQINSSENLTQVFRGGDMPGMAYRCQGVGINPAGTSGKQNGEEQTGEGVSFPLNTFGTFGNKSTEALKYMQTLPGVGIKTAKVVLSHLYDAPFIGVDTHIHRVMNRMGIVKTKTPEETDKKLEKLLTDEQKRTMHHAIVLFGRYVCTARKCHCGETPLKEWCRCEECTTKRV